jgi:peroxiredoxin
MKAVRLIGAMVALAIASQVHAEGPEAHLLRPGDRAPEFTLLSNEWKEVRLSDFRGKKNVVLVFYVLAFTDT